MNGRSNNTGIPANLKRGVEQASGHNMADVRVQTNSAQPQRMQAQAYTQGSNIHLSSGQAQHLPHEMAHVQQQRQGRVQATNGAANLQNKGRR